MKGLHELYLTVHISFFITHMIIQVIKQSHLNDGVYATHLPEVIWLWKYRKIILKDTRETKEESREVP